MYIALDVCNGEVTRTIPCLVQRWWTVSCLWLRMYVYFPCRCHSCSSGTTSPHCKCPTHWDQPPELMPGSALSLQADSVIGTINASTSRTLQVLEPPSLLQITLHCQQGCPHTRGSISICQWKCQPSNYKQLSSPQISVEAMNHMH